MRMDHTHCYRICIYWPHHLLETDLYHSPNWWNGMVLNQYLRSTIRNIAGKANNGAKSRMGNLHAYGRGCPLK